jgi:hypothetical protein
VQNILHVAAVNESEHCSRNWASVTQTTSMGSFRRGSEAWRRRGTGYAGELRLPRESTPKKITLIEQLKNSDK